MNHDRSLSNLKKTIFPTIHIHTGTKHVCTHTYAHKNILINTYGAQTHINMQKQVHIIVCIQAQMCTGMCLCMHVHTHAQTHTGFLVTWKGKAESDAGTLRHSQLPSLFCDVSSLTINFLLSRNLVMRKMKKASSVMWLSSSDLVS